MNFLKTHTDFIPKRSLKYQIHKHLSTMDEHRGTDTIHASELTKEDGICPRFYALNSIVKSPMSERSVSTSENATWEIGRIWQDRIVNYFSDIGIAISHWECTNNNCKLFYKYGRRPKECVKCGCTSFIPKEPRFLSSKMGASCGVDMMAQFPDDDEVYAVEIKTMDKDEFKKLSAPLAEHRLRTNFYLRIIGDSDDPFAKRINKKTALVFYTSKGGYGALDPEVKNWFGESFSPFKEYEVKRDDKATNGMAALSKIAFDFRKGLIGMPNGICATAFEKRAKDCGRRKACFSGEYPAVHHWS